MLRINSVQYHSVREACKARSFRTDDEKLLQVLQMQLGPDFWQSHRCLPQFCPTATEAIQETLGRGMTTWSSRTFTFVSEGLENYIEMLLMH